MNTQVQEKPREMKRKQEDKQSPAGKGVVWFDIPAENPERAKKFYGSLLGWRFEKFPAAVHEYWVINTGGDNDQPGDADRDAHAGDDGRRRRRQDDGDGAAQRTDLERARDVDPLAPHRLLRRSG